MGVSIQGTKSEFIDSVSDRHFRSSCGEIFCSDFEPCFDLHFLHFVVVDRERAERRLHSRDELLMAHSRRVIGRSDLDPGHRALCVRVERAFDLFLLEQAVQLKSARHDFGDGAWFALLDDSFDVLDLHHSAHLSRISRNQR